MRVLLKNLTAVTMDEQNPLVENCYILVENGKIAALGTQLPAGDFDRIIDGSGKIAMPGLINTHTHLPMTLLRGYADDYALQDWLHNHIFPAEATLDALSVELGTTLGLAEAIRFGTTSVSEMYFKLPAIAQACYDSGIKANLSNGALCFDRENYSFARAGETAEMEEMLAHWHMKDDGRIKLDVGIHAEYTSFPSLWQANAEYALEKGLNLQIHVSETQREHLECLERYGKTPVQVLEEYGVLGPRVTAAHCVWITPEDMVILAKHGATVAHNPVSNLKLASGIAPVGQMLAAGINVALGTDGVASNNSHDLFEEIKLCALLQKGTSGDPSLLPAGQALYCATRAGALAQGRHQECGQLKCGMDADLILVDATGPALEPVHSPISALCYSATGREVSLTMVRGKILYENGQFTTIDYPRVLAQAKEYALPRLPSQA